jgi:two-component system sensor histidine kinase YesM
MRTMIAVAILPVLISTLIATYNIKNFSENEYVNGNLSRVSWGAQYLEELIQQLDRMFYSIQINNELISSMGNLDNPDKSIQYKTQSYISETLSTAYYANSRKIDKLILYSDEDKKSFGVSYNNIGDVRNVEKLTGYLERIERTKTNIYFDEIDKDIYAVHSLNEFANQKMFGALIVKVRDDFWDELISILGPNNEGDVYIFNDEMVLLKGSSDSNQSQKTIEAIMAHQDSGYSDGRLIKTEDFYYFVHEVDESKMLLVKGVPVSLVNASQTKVIQAGIFITITFVLISVILSIIISLRISKPIIGLAKIMKSADLENPIAESHHNIEEINLLEKGYNKMIYRLKKLIKDEYQLEIELKNAQLLALQAQINPHFLNNTLNLIGGMALEKDVHEIYDVTRSISDLLRYALTNSDDLVTIQDELDHVKNYLLIQEKRYEDRCEIYITIDESVNSVMVPKFIIQPMIENAFEYGLQPKRGKWLLKVKVFRKGRRIGISILDNGVGMSLVQLQEVRGRISGEKKSTSDYQKGIGLRNVSSRLKIKFNESSGIRVFSKEGKGTLVLISIVEKDLEDLEHV